MSYEFWIFVFQLALLSLAGSGIPRLFKQFSLIDLFRLIIGSVLFIYSMSLLEDSPGVNIISILAYITYRRISYIISKKINIPEE